MKNFSLVARLPEVIGAALTDDAGTLLEFAGRVDGEVAGAVHAFTARTLSQAGEALGLNVLERITLVGDRSARVLAISDNSVLGVEVDPSKPLAALEKKIWDTVTK